ncbi:uncharacterized protein LOC134205190 [Armigeres subalbatus]|uniref:uncharacterized protein LOC134205190 n=1 Tax=Armigeres subalbatus TaxID=124917 RepID=UPI002ED55F0F
MLNIFVLLATISIAFANQSEHALIIDIIDETFPEEINNQFIAELHQNGQDGSISEDLDRIIQNHITSMQRCLPSSEAIYNFLRQFSSNQQNVVQRVLKKALIISLNEDGKEKPIISRPLHPPPFSPKRLQQMLPEKLQREILEEVFLRGGLQFLSISLRQKIEELIQLFPPNIRQDIRDIVEETKSSGVLPHANEELKTKISNYFWNLQSSNAFSSNA